MYDNVASYYPGEKIETGIREIGKGSSSRLYGCGYVEQGGR